MSRDWVWIEPRVLLAVHGEQLAEHGGPGGVREPGLFESALARPRHLALYADPAPDAAALAACYAHGIARNHPFVDGNKRTAFVAAELFLLLNGEQLGADDADCVMQMLALADGSLDEAGFAAWLRRHLLPQA